jgi:hypothetical protein
MMAANSQSQFSPDARERMAQMLDCSNQFTTALSAGITRVCEGDMQALTDSEMSELAPILLALAGIMATTRELADSIRARTVAITQSN